jgi:hypothetical protein
MVLWRSWTVRNKVARAGEPLSIDDSVLYLRSLGKSLSELTGAQGSAMSILEGQVDGKIKCPGRNVAMVHVEVVLRHFHRCHYRSSPLWFFYWRGLWSLGR